MAGMLLELRIFANEKVLDIVSVISCASIIAFMYVGWKRDVEVYNSHANTYLWHKYPVWIIFVILAVLTLLYEAVAINVDFSKSKLRYSIFLYYALVICIGGFLNYFLDYLSVDFVHGSAVFNSVYNVMHGVPYKEISNSVYGNYALLLAAVSYAHSVSHALFSMDGVFV